MCTDDYHAYVMIAQEYMAFTTPHPLKKQSIELGNMPVVMVLLMIYSDDTSGNKSKMCAYKTGIICLTIHAVLCVILC